MNYGGRIDSMFGPRELSGALFLRETKFVYSGARFWIP